MLSFRTFCKKYNLDRTKRKGRDYAMNKYLKYKYFMKYVYYPCTFYLFMQKLYNYEPDLVDFIKFLIVGSYKWKPISNSQIPIIQEMSMKKHSEYCYASYYGVEYYVKSFSSTTNYTSCARCKIQRDFEYIHGEPEYWIMNNITDKIMMHTNNEKKLKTYIKQWGMKKHLIEIVDSPWWYNPNRYILHTKFDFPQYGIDIPNRRLPGRAFMVNI